jgi:uncharacterized protein (TIGR02594 family)
MTKLRVTAVGLNLRSDPRVTDDNIITSMRQGLIVESIRESVDQRWNFVRFARNGTTFEGWASKRHLAAVTVEPVQGEKPRWVTIAEGELGVTGIVGNASNPRVDEFLRTTTFPDEAIAQMGDEIPWCSAFVNWCMEQAGLQGTDSAAARSWLFWNQGKPLTEPVFGCVVIFLRLINGVDNGKAGHVGFWMKTEGDKVHVLGGNQKNKVSVDTYPLEHVLGYRFPRTE